MKYTKNVVDAAIRADVFNTINLDELDCGFVRINDRQWGVLTTDLNGVERYVRIGVIVAEEREDMTARELMESEIAKYNEAQEKKEEKKRKAAEKAERDKKRREEEKAKEEVAE